MIERVYLYTEVQWAVTYIQRSYHKQFYTLTYIQRSYHKTIENYQISLSVIWP